MISNQLKYSSGYKYQLKSDVVIQTALRPVNPCVIQGYVFLDTDGELRIYLGYAWDGCTSAPDTKTNLLAGLVHDALYQLMQEGVLDQSFKPDADEMLRNVMISQGSFNATANLFHFAVQELGGLHMKAKKVTVLPIK
ncbi:MAG: hypothetical protein K2Q45_00045 [Nitrosomonas sp.]|nr:hypothetical protein [Nitrosomonas sp.]